MNLAVCRTLADLRLLLQVPDPLEIAKNERIDWNLLEKLLKNLKASEVVSDKYGVKSVCIVAHHFVLKPFSFFFTDHFVDWGLICGEITAQPTIMIISQWLPIFLNAAIL